MGIMSGLKKAWNSGRKAVTKTVKNIASGFKHLLKPINKVLKRALKNPIIRVAAIAAAGVFLTPAVAGMLASTGTGMFAAGTIATDVAAGAITGGLIQGTVGAIEGKNVLKAAGTGAALGGIAGGAANFVGASPTAAAAAKNNSGLMSTAGTATDTAGGAVSNFQMNQPAGLTNLNMDGSVANIASGGGGAASSAPWYSLDNPNTLKVAGSAIQGLGTAYVDYKKNQTEQQKLQLERDALNQNQSNWNATHSGNYDASALNGVGNDFVAAQTGLPSNQGATTGQIAAATQQPVLTTQGATRGQTSGLLASATNPNYVPGQMIHQGV